MDPFDDILSVAPAARARPGSKFMPKAKAKQKPRKETSASELAASSQDGISRNECHNAVASTLSMAAEESNHPQVELTNLEVASNSEMGDPQQVSVKGDTVALVDDLPSTIAASEADADRNFTDFPKSTCEVDTVDYDVGLVTNFLPETNVNNGTPQPVTENELNNVPAPPTTCSTVDRMEEPLKNGEDPFLDSNKHLEPVDNSLQVGLDVGLKSASDDKVAIFECNIHSDFNFGREREVVATEFDLDPFSSVLPDPGARNAHKFQPKSKPKIKPRPRAGNKPAIATASSTVMIEKSVELPTSCTNEIQSGGVNGSGLNQSTSLHLPTSEIPRTLSNKVDYMSSSIPFSDDNRSFAPVIPSQLDSLNAMLSEAEVHNGAGDWPPSFSKSSGEAADIFSGLESLGGDFLTQAATDTGELLNTGKPALDSLNKRGAEENLVIPACSSVSSLGVSDTTQAQRCPEYHARDSLTFDEAAVLNEDVTCSNNRRSETEEVVDLNVACEDDDMFGYQPMKAGGADPTSEIPVHEELMNAVDSPTLADFFNAENTGENTDASGRKKSSTMSSSSRKRRRSSITSEEDKGGKTTRKLLKQAARKPANSSLNENVEDDDDDIDPLYNPSRDQHEENDDEYEVDCSSKKKRAPTSSKKKSVAKNGKKSQKLKNDDDDDLEKTTKAPRKKFSHSSRRRKRCVEEIPEDEPDPRTWPIKKIILLAEQRERRAKKGPTTSSTPVTNQSVGDAFHETGAFDAEDIYGAYHNEEEIIGSEDRRDPDDDQAEETVPLAPSLFNYQSFMEKTPRVKWSKQDTELFYEAVSQLGTDFSMIELLFPGRTRHQIKLKYKKEERQHPLRLSDAVNSSSKDPSCFKLVIERLRQASAKAEDDAVKDLPSDLMTGEEVEDVTPGTYEEEAATMEEEEEEVTTTKQDADVKDQEDSGALRSPEQSENSDDDQGIWADYKSEY